MSTTLSDDHHQYTFDMEAEARGRHLLPDPPSGLTGRSRSTPRRPQVAPPQIRRVASTQNLTKSRPFPLPNTAFDSTTGGAAPLFTNSLSSDFVRSPDMHRYGNVDHDHTLGDPDRTPIRLSPIDKNGGGGDIFVSANSLSSWVLPGSDRGSASLQGSPRMDNFLTGGDARLHLSSSYYNLSLLSQPSFGTFPPEAHTVPTIGSDSVVEPSSASARAGVGDNRTVPLTTTDTATSQETVAQPSQSTSSVKPRKFRTTVGSKAMVEACKKRRKQRDGAARLFVCEIPDCGRNFTARHNLRCTFFSIDYHTTEH